MGEDDEQRHADAHSALLARIYQAALQPGDWTGVMRMVGDSVQASSAFMFSSHSKTDRDAVLLVHNHAPDMPAEFSRYWYTQDPWAMAAGRLGLMKRNTLVVGSEMVPRRELLRTAFYSDFSRHHAIEALLGCVLFGDNESDGMPFTNLSWYRQPGKPDFDLDSKRRIAQVMPHIQQAMRLQRQMLAIAAPQNPAARALAALEIASLLLDARGAVQQCNDAGARLLSAQSGTASYRGGRMRAIGARCVPALDDAMAQCRDGTPVRMLACLAGTHAAVVNATLLKLPAATPTHVGGFDAERWLLLVEMPRSALAQIAHRVADLFGLSRAEVRVLALLLEGCAAAEIAGRTGTSLPTVRTHIRSIFGKTEVTRQIDLVRRLSGLRA